MTALPTYCHGLGHTSWPCCKHCGIKSRDLSDLLLEGGALSNWRLVPTTRSSDITATTILTLDITIRQTLWRRVACLMRGTVPLRGSMRTLRLCLYVLNPHRQHVNDMLEPKPTIDSLSGLWRIGYEPEANSASCGSGGAGPTGRQRRVTDGRLNSCYNRRIDFSGPVSPIPWRSPSAPVTEVNEREPPKHGATKRRHQPCTAMRARNPHGPQLVYSASTPSNNRATSASPSAEL